MTNLFKIALASVGAAMAAPVVSNLYTEYVAPTAFGSFLDDFGFGAKQAGEAGSAVARTLFGTSVTTMGDMPDVELNRATSMAAASIGAAGQVTSVPMGRSPTVPGIAQRPAVRDAIIKASQTIPLAKPNIRGTARTIKLGSTQYKPMPMKTTG
jgi:hypothetical protein|tara:strand:- start:33 stop:494 length:462 start_codon:yes stop_codon:yes gene_type:complete